MVTDPITVTRFTRAGELEVEVPAYVAVLRATPVTAPVVEDVYLLEQPVPPSRRGEGAERVLNTFNVPANRYVCLCFPETGSGGRGRQCLVYYVGQDSAGDATRPPALRVGALMVGGLPPQRPPVATGGGWDWHTPGDPMLLPRAQATGSLTRWGREISTGISRLQAELSAGDRAIWDEVVIFNPELDQYQVMMVDPDETAEAPDGWVVIDWDEDEIPETRGGGAGWLLAAAAAAGLIWATSGG